MGYSRTFLPLLAALALGGAATVPALALERDELTIATTPAGTIFFSIGGGMARVLQEDLGVRSSPRPYGSPSRCLPLLDRDDVPLALVSSVDAGRAYAGLAPYPHANTNVRLLARVLPLMNGYFVRADSPYQTIDDIRGARMIYEIRGSHAQTLLAEAVLATGGLTRDDIVPVAAAHVVESIDALIEAEVVAGHAHAGAAQAVGVEALGVVGKGPVLAEGGGRVARVRAGEGAQQHSGVGDRARIPTDGVGGRGVGTDELAIDQERDPGDPVGIIRRGRQGDHSLDRSARSRVGHGDIRQACSAAAGRELDGSKGVDHRLGHAVRIVRPPGTRRTAAIGEGAIRVGPAPADHIGDLGGLEMAYGAYKLSLGGKEAPVIDGFTGDQRFFLAFAQAWRGKIRDDALRAQLLTDPHSPAAARGQLPLRNVDAWYEAFGVKEGDKLYLKPEERVKIW